MEWFGSVDSIEQLKSEYLHCLQKWKKDEGVMKEINQQYRDLLLSLGVEYNEKIEEQNKSLPLQYQKEKIDFKHDKYAETLNKIIDFNMSIEIIGQWIWCFESYEYHEQLKELGFWYSKSKKAWVFSGTQKKKIRSHNKVDDLRKKWGTEKIRDKEEA